MDNNITHTVTATVETLKATPPPVGRQRSYKGPGESVTVLGQSAPGQWRVASGWYSSVDTIADVGQDQFERTAHHAEGVFGDLDSALEAFSAALGQMLTRRPVRVAGLS